MFKYIKIFTRIREFIVDGVLLSRRKVRIRLTKKNILENLVLTLTNIFYLLNNLSNFINLSFFNNAEIYYHNKDQILYNQNTQKTFTFSKRYKTSFFLYLFYIFSVIVNLFINNKVYKGLKVN